MLWNYIKRVDIFKLYLKIYGSILSVQATYKFRKWTNDLYSNYKDCLGTSYKYISLVANFRFSVVYYDDLGDL